MRNKNAQPIQRLALLLLFACTLTGCVLTLVSDSALAKEVDSLNVVGLSLDAARQRATEKGFVCSEYSNLAWYPDSNGKCGILTQAAPIS